MKKRTPIVKTLSALLLLLLLLPGSVQAQDPGDAQSRSLFAMDTYMTLTAYGSPAAEALDAAEEEILRLDDLLSTEKEDSEISMLNRTGQGQLSDTSAYLMQRSLEVNAMSRGAFNPMIYPLMEEWGFTGKEYQIPPTQTISDLLKLVDLSRVSFDAETGDISFGEPGMAVDFGGIAKGYTSSRIMEIFSEKGVESAVVSLGGNVQTLGAKPDGSLWKVAVRDPFDSDSYLGILQVSDQAVITSGGYERYFEQDGKTWHHILDPSTGYPAERGLLSVTVISDDGTLADALSTALFVQGLDKAYETWQENSTLFQAVFLTEDQQVYVTEGMADYFSSDRYPVHILTLS